jgi:CheY-like chemotaxis protein
MRVLVVDDDPTVGSSVAAALRRDGHGVQTLTNGPEALQRLGGTSYDCVVLDVLMPGLDGLEVCRTLRARGDLTPVLMLTARDLVADRVEGSTLVRTTIWSSRSRSKSCALGYERWSVARRPRDSALPTRCASRISSSIRPPARFDAGIG